MEMPNCPLEVAALTDVGCVRSCNEDAVAVDREHGIAIVADGMGGHRAGEVASRMARDIVLAALRRHRSKNRTTALHFIEHALGQANHSILAAAQDNPNYRGMGTTIALLLFHGASVSLAHIGDSRIYRLRAGRLSLLTRDDSLLSDQVEWGLISTEETGASRNRHLVTEALGIRQQLSPSLREEALQADDVFLICSDGLNDMVDDADIELILRSLHMNLSLAASHLVQLANDHGGLDNVSVVLVKARAWSAPARTNGWLSRLFRWMR
jgi:protein phosphatase